MNAPDADALHVVETLRAELPAAMRSGAVSGAEGWSLRDVRTEHVFERPVATLTLTREGHSLRAHLFPMHALANPYARIRHFDLYHLDDLLPGHEPAAQALLDGLLHWLDRTLVGATNVSFLDPAAPEAPAAPPETAAVLATLREGLPALLATEALAGWSLTRLGVERFRRMYVPRIDLARAGNNALRLFLLPRGTEETCHFHTERFDMVYDDDARGSTYSRNHAVMEHFAAWLDASFPAAPPPPPPPPRTPAERLALALDERLALALREGALPELAGWTFAGATAERFRGDTSPTVRIAREGRAIALHLLPSGAEPSAALRTDRFDLVYDDDARSTTFTRDHAALEALARWLGAAFPADEAPRPKRRRHAEGDDEATRRAEAEAAALHEAFARAFAAGELPELAGWAFDGVALEAFRDGDVPTARLTQGGETLSIRLLPTNPESGAHFRTERFDLLYDDADGALFARHHAALEALTRWLDLAFPLGEGELARELARRRALRARQIHATDEQVALADALDAKLREAVAGGAFTLPEGWRLDGVTVDQQQGVTAPAVRFLHGERAFVLRVLPTAPERATPLRTARYDVLYDSEPGDWQRHDEPVARGLVAWLDATFPAEEKPAEEKPVEEKPVEEKPVEEKPVEEKPAEEKPADG